jgi:endoglucanase
VIINVHQYFDSNFSGNHDTCVSSGFNLQSFSDWLKAEGLKAMVTEFNTPYDNPASCQTVLSSFVQYLTDNKASAGTGGFIGATLWGAGRGWNTGASDPADRYILLVTPDSYQYNTFMQGVVTP